MLRMCCGRSSEPAYITWNSMEWDDYFSNVFFVVPQLKTSEAKVTCIVPGATRHECTYTLIGDYLALNPNRDLHAEPGDEAWLFPTLQEVDNMGEKLGSWMKAVLPHIHGGAQKYARVARSDIPTDITAAGMRPAIYH